MVKIFVSISLIAALLLSGCMINMVTGSSRLLTETRKVSGITDLTIAGMGEVTIIQGATESLTVEAEDNILPHIVTEVQNGQLTIRMDKLNFQNIIRPTKTIHYTLNVKKLNSIKITGLATALSESLRADTFTATMGGAGRIQVDNLQVSNLNVTISGAGDIHLSGLTAQQKVTLSGVGSYRGGDMQSLSSSVTVSGAGGAQVWATSTLDVRLSGAGSVSYFGAPKLTKDVSGVGVLNSLGMK